MNDASEQSRSLTLDTSVGMLLGEWMGASPVRTGEAVDVELDLGQPREWDALTRPGTSSADAASQPIAAIVELVFDDGIVALRIGEGTAQLEITGDIPPDAVGSTVWITAGDLEFFPTGI